MMYDLFILTSNMGFKADPGFQVPQQGTLELPLFQFVIILFH